MPFFRSPKSKRTSEDAAAASGDSVGLGSGDEAPASSESPKIAPKRKTKRGKKERLADEAAAKALEAGPQPAPEATEPPPVDAEVPEPRIPADSSLLEAEKDSVPWAATGSPLGDSKGDKLDRDDDVKGLKWSVSCGSATMRGQRHERNEDRRIVRRAVHAGQRSILGGVFDGHGGAEAAEYVRRRLHVALRYQLAHVESGKGAKQTTTSTATDTTQVAAATEGDEDAQRAQVGTAASDESATASSEETESPIRPIAAEVFTQAMSNAFDDMESAFCCWARNLQPNDTSGACALACVVDRVGGACYIASTGDSASVFFAVDKKKKLLEVTGSHRQSCHDSFEQDRMYNAYTRAIRNEDECGLQSSLRSRRLFDPDGSIQGLEPSRTVGDVDVKDVFGDCPIVIATPIVSTHSFVESSKALFNAVVLASDGVWDVFTAAEAAEFVRKLLLTNSKGPFTADVLDFTADALCRAAEQKGSDDDITVVIFIVTEAKKK